MFQHVFFKAVYILYVLKSVFENECSKSGEWFVRERFSDICWHCRKFETLFKNSKLSKLWMLGSSIKWGYHKKCFFSGPVGYNFWWNLLFGPKNGPSCKCCLLQYPPFYVTFFQISANMAQEEGTEEQVVKR